MLALEVEEKAMSQGMQVASQRWRNPENEFLEPLQSRDTLIWAQ